MAVESKEVFMKSKISRQKRSTKICERQKLSTLGNCYFVTMTIFVVDKFDWLAYNEINSREKFF